MKILILSDSHGDVDAMLQAVKKTSPQMVIHLGDCWRDVEPVMERFPELPFFRVPGNCDFRPQNPLEQIITLEGHRVMICHGHTFGVKQGMREAEEVAKREKLDAFLFGHTHRPLVAKKGRTLFFNPGSCGLGNPCTYGVLNAERDQLNARVYTLKELDLSSYINPRPGLGQVSRL